MNKSILLGLIYILYLIQIVYSQTTVVPSTNAVTGTPTPTSNEKKSGFPLWALAPIIGGSLAIMAGIGGAFFYFRNSGGNQSKYNYDEKKNDKKKEEKKKEEKKKEEKKKEDSKKEDSKKEDSSDSSEKSEKEEKRQNYQVVCHHCKYPVVDTRYDHCYHCGYDVKCKKCNYFLQVHNGLCQNNCVKDNNQNNNQNNNQSCYKCKQEIHDLKSDYCHHCGRVVKCKKCDTYYEYQNGLCKNNCDNHHNNQNNNNNQTCFSCKQEIYDLKTEYCHNCGRLCKCKKCENFYQPPNGLCRNNCNRESDKFNNVKYYQHYLQSQEYQNQENVNNNNQHQNQQQYQQYQHQQYYQNYCYHCKNNINDLNSNNCYHCGKSIKCKKCNLVVQGNTGMCKNNCVN